MVEKIAVVAIIVAISGVAAANVLSRMVANGELPIIVLARSDAEARRLVGAPSPWQAPSRAHDAGAARPGAGVDMSATASIPGAGRSAPSLLPCGVDRQ